MAQQQFEDLRRRAIELRRHGRSRREIKDTLGVRSNRLLDRLLQGEPPPEWTRRPNAKDDLRAQARRLRDEGKSYNEIVAKLGVSKSSVSLWVRDLPRPIGEDEQRRRSTEAQRKRRRAEREQTDDARNATRLAAAREIGELTDRDLLLAGAMLYWCEGTKTKPSRRSDRVIFTNSDPRLIDLFMRFLDVAGIARERLRFRLQIHESVDVAEATEFWLNVSQVGRWQFYRTTIKPADGPTVRKNVGDDYRGCLQVTVLGSADLYWRITGWTNAIAGEVPMDATEREDARTLERAPVWDAVRRLHADGWGYRRIAEELGLPRQTVETRLRDHSRLAELIAEEPNRRAAGVRLYWEEQNARLANVRSGRVRAAAAEVGELDDRTVILLGALAYWCEGTKSKPYRPVERVAFFNRDPRLVAFFLRFLALAGVAHADLRFRVHIHESGDLADAERFWSEQVGVEPSAFQRATIKRNVPRTTYPDGQPAYHGCLRIDVCKAAELYRRIEGWAMAALLGERSVGERGPADGAPGDR